jgi:uncharacterized protein (DUF1015 family)
LKLLTVQVRPFYGYLPSAENISEVICPADAIIDRNSAAKLAKAHPQSIVRILHPEVDFADCSSNDPSVFQRGVDNNGSRNEF